MHIFSLEQPITTTMIKYVACLMMAAVLVAISMALPVVSNLHRMDVASQENVHTMATII